MGRDDDRGTSAPRLARLPGSALGGRVRRRVTSPGLSTLGRAAALLLVVAGAVALLHPVLRSVLGGAPGVLAVLVGTGLLYVLVDPLGLLRRVEYRILGALLETLFPETADVGGEPVAVAERLHRLFPALPLLDRLAIRATAWLVFFSPVLVVPSLRPFPLLGQGDRQAVTSAWGSTRIVPLRALFTLVKGTLAMIHFEREAVQDTLGWSPSDSGYEVG